MARTLATDRSPALPVGLGLLALALGLFVYLSDRPPGHAALIPGTWSVGGEPIFGAVGAWLPSFLHPFAFVLFTAATLPRSAAAARSACALWWGIDLVFELAQHPALSAPLAAALEAIAGRQGLSNYLLRGRFDAADVMALTAGACAAALVLRALPLQWRRRASREPRRMDRRRRTAGAPWSWQAGPGPSIPGSAHMRRTRRTRHGRNSLPEARHET